MSSLSSLFSYNPPTNGVPGNFNFWGEREHGERSYERCNRESF